MRRVIITSVVACLLSAVTLPAVSLAQSVDEQVSQLEAEAAKAYGAGDYKAAIALMAKANQLRPHPNYLLNIAVSYSKIGDCDNAKLWAQNAVDAVNPSLPDEGKDTGRAVIQQCKEATVVTPPTDLDPKDPADPVEPDPIVPDPTEPTPWLLYTGYGLAGFGSLVFLASFLGDLSLGSDIEDFNGRSTDEAGYEADRADLEDRQGSVTFGYGFGGLTAIAGGVLIYLEMTKDDSASAWRVTPLLDRSTVGLGFSLDLP